MEKEKPADCCAECKHFMLLCGAGSWCYKFHVRTSAAGRCDYSEREEFPEETRKRYIDGYAEQQPQICP